MHNVVNKHADVRTHESYSTLVRSSRQIEHVVTSLRVVTGDILAHDKSNNICNEVKVLGELIPSLTHRQVFYSGADRGTHPANNDVKHTSIKPKSCNALHYGANSILP